MSATAHIAKTGRKSPASLEAAARHAREARIRFRRVFVVSSFFVVVLGANLIVGAVVVMGNIRAQATADNMWANGQVAQAKRPLLDGTFCSNMVINNRTSQTIEDKVERCDQGRSKFKAKARSQFNWGGK
jgi:hypothetical protein